MSVIGLRVGPFEVVEAARVPEPGDWYLARRTGLTRRQPHEVLVKLLPPDAPAEARAALQREFEALRGLDDPRVPEPVAFYEGSGALALGPARGTPLAALVAARREDAAPMTPSTLLDIALELSEALQHAHHRGRLHGHLSPDEVLLGAEGQLWIFGLGPGPAARPSEEWLPPERARGEPVTAATDQWSLAALLTALITGHAPWRGVDPEAEARRGEPGGSLEPVIAQWPALGRLLRRMLDPHAANRFPSLSPVRQELLALARKASGTSDRRDLGARLAARHGTEAEPVEAEAPPPDSAPAADSPAESAEAPADPPVVTDGAEPTSAARAEPPPARRRPVDPLPSEAMPVVRPDLEEDVPLARVGDQDDPDTADLETEHAEEVLETELVDLEDRATELADVEDRATELIGEAKPPARFDLSAAVSTEAPPPRTTPAPEPARPVVVARAEAAADPDEEPSIASDVRVVLATEALLGASGRGSGAEGEPSGSTEATLVVDGNAILRAARRKARIEDEPTEVRVALKVDRRRARETVERAAREADREPSASFEATLLLDAASVLRATGAGPASEADDAPSEVTVVVDAGALLAVLAEDDDAEATVLLDADAVLGAMAASRRARGIREDADALEVEVEVEETDAGSSRAATGVTAVPFTEVEPLEPEPQEGASIHDREAVLASLETRSPLEPESPLEPGSDLAGPELEQVLPEGELPEAAPDRAPPAITTVAPWLAVGMVALMLLYMLVRMIS